MAQYNYKGKKITISDQLVKEYKKINYNEEPDNQLLKRFIDLDYGDLASGEFDKITDEEISKTVAYYMDVEIRANR